MDAHSSKYHGLVLCSDTLLTVSVKILLVYPSHAHESCALPPLPDAHTKMEPFPPRPCNVNNCRALVL